jgi:prepilin signal peptidase PulO-like enzyme (type II secretory pathway)
MQCPHCYKKIAWIVPSIERPSLTEGRCGYCQRGVKLTFSFFYMAIMLLVAWLIAATMWGKASSFMLIAGLALAVVYGSLKLVESDEP